VINVAISIAIGVRMPSPPASDDEANHPPRCDGWCTVPYRPLDQPPFFFHEFRHVWLSMAITFAIVRLIFEGANADISVIVVIVRLLGLVAQLRFTTWLCTHWRPFFYDKEIVPLLSLLSYGAFAFFFFAWSFTVLDDGIWLHFAVRLVLSPAALVHYLWSKHWVLAFGPVDPARRFVGVRSYAATVCVLSLCVMVWDLAVGGAVYAGNNGFIQSFGLSFVLTCSNHYQERRRARITRKVEHVSQELQSMEVGLFNSNGSGHGKSTVEDINRPGDNNNDNNNDNNGVYKPTPVVGFSMPRVMSKDTVACAADEASTQESSSWKATPRRFAVPGLEDVAMVALNKAVSFKRRLSHTRVTLSKHQEEEDTYAALWTNPSYPSISSSPPMQPTLPFPCCLRGSQGTPRLLQNLGVNVPGVRLVRPRVPHRGHRRRRVPRAMVQRIRLPHRPPFVPSKIR
jgi:hypothetical protein